MNLRPNGHRYECVCIRSGSSQRLRQWSEESDRRYRTEIEGQSASITRKLVKVIVNGIATGEEREKQGLHRRYYWGISLRVKHRDTRAVTSSLLGYIHMHPASIAHLAIVIYAPVDVGYE